MNKEAKYFKEVHEFRKKMHVELLAFELSMHHKYLNGSDSLSQAVGSSFDDDVFSETERKNILFEAKKMLQLKYKLEIKSEKPLIIYEKT